MSHTPFIYITDEQPPEANAMLQALYSRDPQSVVDHLKRVAEVGSDKFMNLYYVGYGHKSIGDCGSTTIFAEQVSMLSAKAIQDWPLYNGQEASTRYLDMSKQVVLNPLESVEGQKIQDEWMYFYNHALATLIPLLMEMFPIQENQKSTVYEKAIKAKAFDIARGFLPAGITTLLSWHTNLRQAYDHLQQLAYHPLKEVRELANAIHTELKTKYTNSFSHKFYEGTETFYSNVIPDITYFYDDTINGFQFESQVDEELVKQFSSHLSARPEKTDMPHYFKRLGNIRCKFLLDFGSYRDLQRHRSGTIPMPLLSTKKGFHPWYLDQLPKTLEQEAQQLIESQTKQIQHLDCDEAIKQYYTAMGFQCTCEAVLPLTSAVYISEIRSAQTVHPTLRIMAQDLGKALMQSIPELAMHCDMSDDEWNIKRGTHDIVKK